MRFDFCSFIGCLRLQSGEQEDEEEEEFDDDETDENKTELTDCAAYISNRFIPYLFLVSPVSFSYSPLCRSFSSIEINETSDKQTDNVAFYLCEVYPCSARLEMVIAQKL